MVVSTNGAALVSEAEKSAILAQAEAMTASADYDGDMDFHGVVSVKRTAFDLDTRTCRVPTILTDKDGIKSAGYKVISKKSMYGVIFRKMNTVRGANLRDDGTIDYSEGLPVHVTWTVKGKEQCALFRVAYAIYNGHDAQTSRIVCAYKSATTGQYLTKKFLTGNIVHVVSAE
jgi:hypothetical protein